MSVTYKNGGIVLADIINNQRIERFYLGFTLSESKNMFLYEIKLMQERGDL